MNRALKRNIIKSPVVLLVRGPIMVVLLVLNWIGRVAYVAHERLDRKLPAFDRWEDE